MCIRDRWIDCASQAMVVLRCVTVAPQQHILLVANRAKAACFIDGGPVIAEAGSRAINRSDVVTVVDIKLQGGAVGIRWRLAQDNSAGAAGQQNRRREAGDAERGAARRRHRAAAEWLFDISPRQI